MKRILFLLIAGLSLTTSKAQDITDALRYSDEFLNGTARFNAMSGAFGALGGDQSAIAINPAGSAVFVSNSFSFTTGWIDTKNSSNYFGTRAGSSDNDFNFNQAGAVFVFDNWNSNSPWTKFTLGLTYNSTRNFDDELFIAGTGNETIGDFFLDQAQGTPLNLLQLQSGESISSLYGYLGSTNGVGAQNAFLGYQGFIIDPVDPDNGNNTAYTSAIAPGSFNQNYYLSSSGYAGKYTFNFATQYKNRFTMGINLNSHYVNYRRRTFLTETNSNTDSNVSRVGFENTLYTRGVGFSAQFGAIAKVTEAFRVGVTYSTPTWYQLSDETTQYLETRALVNGENTNSVVDPRVINIFPNYEIRTPSSLLLSTAYVFGAKGLISFDYTYRDYSNIQLRPTYDSQFASQNTLISNQLKGVSIYRIGGEYRIDQFSLRGGYSYTQSPFRDKTFRGETVGYSAGIGYNFGSMTFDFSYNRAEQDRQQNLFGLASTANVNTKLNNYVFTLGFNL